MEVVGHFEFSRSVGLLQIRASAAMWLLKWTRATASDYALARGMAFSGTMTLSNTRCRS